MTRPAILVDRVVVLLVGALLLVVGAAALLWHTGLIPQFPVVLTAPALRTVTDDWWWPWAVAGVGIVCVVVALRWLLAHRPSLKADPIRLPQSDVAGTLSIDPAAVATAAAAALARDPAVDGAKGKAVTDRGTRIIELAVTAAHPNMLGAVVEAIDATCAHLAAATSEATVATRATIHVKGGRALTHTQLE